jgi:hypothetical protein
VFDLVACSTDKTGSNSSVNAATTQTQSQTQSPPDLQKQRQEAEQQARPDVEKERKQAEDEASKNLDQEAMAAIDETQKAIDAIAANKNDQAMAAIEQATGKINILLARNPATALIPVGLQVEVIDAAPHDSKAIAEIVKNASKAVDDKNYPAARVLLYALTSEIRVRTYNLPLATYPAALQEAAHLLDQKVSLEASKVLLTALDTLMAVDRVTPLPLVLAREAIEQAKAKSQSDKAMAQALVETAKKETERAKELGYAGRDPEYTALNSDISNLEKQLKGNEDATSVFAKLEDRLSAFLKRQSQQERR